MCLFKNNKYSVTKFETNKNKGKYLEQSKVKVKSYSEHQENKIVNIYPSIKYQEFIGFGGAITEAAAYAYSLLPENKKHEFINDYFSNLNYSICRISIGSCDFSLSSYSYAKEHDLSDFSLEKDYKYIIPFIKEVLKVNPNLKFLASPWSPPNFMKNTKNACFGGKLLKKYQQTYADYLVKFIKSYAELGINVEYITVQNEPNVAQTWESCLFNPNDEIEFVTNYLYPTFQINDIKTKIIIYDHNKEKLYSRALAEFSNPDMNKATSGIAFHWYTGNHFENLSLCRQTFPDKLLIHSEGCCALNPDDSFPNSFALDINGDLNNGVNAYIDWNILLDSNGGPNHKKNFCNSIVMLNKDNTDYIKSLAFYYMAHYSKFIKPGAYRIAYSKYMEDITLTAFKNPDDSIAVVMCNRKDYDIDFTLCIEDSMFKDKLEAQSMISYVLKK